MKQETRWPDLLAYMDGIGCRRGCHFVESHDAFEIWKGYTRDWDGYYFAQFSDDPNDFITVFKGYRRNHGEFGETDASLRRQLVKLREEAYAMLKGKAHAKLKRKLEIDAAWEQHKQ